MTQQTRSALKELQRMDSRIEEVRERVRAFDPRFEEVEEPALILEGDLNTTEKRVQDMKVEERRLGLSVEEKQVRLKKLEERLGGVRNLREEAAVTSELDMVRRALQSDEQESYTLIDQIRKLEERLDEVREAHAQAAAELEPARDALLAEREAVKKELATLESGRQGFASDIDSEELKIYESIRGRGGRAAVAALTEDGACGNCYGMVPLQVQNEIRHRSTLIRCEACGVILAAPDPQPAEGETAPDEAADAAEEAGTAEEE